MKLTDGGKQFLKATLAGTIVATIVGINIVLAVCLSLVLVALISEIVLARYPASRVEIKPERQQISCFKEEDVRLRLSFQPVRSMLVNVSLSRLALSEGVDAKIEGTDPGEPSLTIKSKFAGRFSGLLAEFELSDPLQLFKKTVESKIQDFRLDCYPLSILKEIRTVSPVSISLGERETRSQGMGMEFHSVDEYHSSSEWKSIFWRKVASMPDEKLLVKKRTANVPKSVSIALIHTINRGKDSPGWMDSACEGVAAIGKTILQIGSDVEIRYDAGGRVVSDVATDIEELLEGLMKMSISQDSDLNGTSLLLTRSDICVTGFKELHNDQLASAIARKPALLIEDVGETAVEVGERAVVYHPHRDLTELVRKVTGI